MMISTNIKRSTFGKYKYPISLYNILNDSSIIVNKNNTVLAAKTNGVKIKVDPYNEDSVEVVIRGEGNKLANADSKVELKSLFKGYTEFAGENNLWSNLNTGMKQSRISHAGCGNINATLAFGGFDDKDTKSSMQSTEMFNGNSWSESHDMNTARSSHAGCGNTNYALAFGGYDTNSDSNLKSTAKFIGNAWVELVDMNVPRYCVAGCGRANNALACGGDGDGIKSPSTIEIFNSFSWSSSSISNLPGNVLSHVGMCGTVGNALLVGGCSSGDSAYSQYSFRCNNGAWAAESIEIGINRTYPQCCGNPNNALMFGGYSDSEHGVYTSRFNGSTWKTISYNNTDNTDFRGSGTVTSALSFGGTTNTTELFSVTNTEQFAYDIEKLKFDYDHMDGISKDITIGYLYSNKPF